MSLLSHLKTKDSPVRKFFELRLGGTDSVVREAAVALRNGRKSPPLAAVPGINPGRVGAAVDYLVRFALAREPCPHDGGVAALGAGMLEGRLAPAARVSVRQGLEFVAAVGAHEREVSDREWEDLARVALLFAVLETCYRSGILPSQFETLGPVPSGWRAWADLVCTQVELEDMATLGWASLEDHLSLRGTNVLCNPVFAQSVALGGADADVLTESGLLIDFKSTSTTKTCSRTDIWQLCGYALADTGDNYEIRSVGLSLLRWRTQVAWPLDELLPTLAGESASVDQLRGEFAALLSRRSLSRGRTIKAGGGVRSGRLVSPGLGPVLDQDGRMVWRCAYCGAVETAREGAPTPLAPGTTLNRVLPPPNWRQSSGRAICPACRKAH